MSAIHTGFDCRDKIVCPGSDDPLANLSAEGYDYRRHIAWVYGPRWEGGCCNQVCESFVSQAEADLCAQNKAVLLEAGYCSPVTNPDGTVECKSPTEEGEPDTDPPLPGIFLNTEQCCVKLCPDGLMYTYCVAAGVVQATSQEQANAIAYSMACRGAALRRFCLSPNPVDCCLNTVTSKVLSISGGNGPFTWTILSGSIPTGLTLTQLAADYRTVLLSGTPTVAGLNTVEVMVQDALGQTLVGNVYIGVVEIAESTLNPAVAGTAYSQQLTLTGKPPGMTAHFSLTSGSLPTGLALSASGLISGTPTGGIPATFTVGFTLT